MKPTITVREFDRETGAFVRSSSLLDFGISLSGDYSGIRVIDFIVTGVSKVSNMSISLSDSDGLEVAPPDAIVTDGLADNGNFGIEKSESFESRSTLYTYFPALDSSVTLAMKSDYVSEFIYLNISPGSFQQSSGQVKYSPSFDFVPIVSSSSSSFSLSSSSSSSSCSCSCSSCSCSCSSSSCSCSSSSVMSYIILGDCVNVSSLLYS